MSVADFVSWKCREGGRWSSLGKCGGANNREGGEVQVEFSGKFDKLQCILFPTSNYFDQYGFLKGKRGFELLHVIGKRNHTR